ncbi:MAG TPA: dipeptide/oligopeptide/nickel ABC transporter ATP-binding protein [Treponema sp.]|nr:dipeptide/oligopeptide/nickel ABC transporter ATP-binding protein [Treponema sp.]
MKQLFEYIKSRPLARVSVIFLCILYLFMICAEFIAPYSATQSFEEGSFHPCNLELSSHGLVAREYRVLNRTSFSYAKVKGLYHKVGFFVKGSEYKIFGLIPCSRHLFGVKPSKNGEVYPLFILGADNLGRDMFSRMVYGSRISLTIGFVASFISLVLAMLFGGIAGYFGGITDWAIMRFSEFFMLIPALYLILFLRSLLNANMDSGQSYMVITLILSLVGWPSTARTLRGMVHSIKREEFVQNARLEKIPALVIIFKYIIPQISSLLIVSTTLSVPGFIMSETTLSYLGLGISDPAVSWGSMINREISTLSNLKNFPWLLNPVWLLLLVTLAFNFFGDALRDFFDPYHVVFRRFKKRASPLRGRALRTSAVASSLAPCGTRDSGATVSDAFLSVRDLNVTFSVRRGVNNVFIHSVRGVSFEMEKGQILGIVGESGSGKSVTTSSIPALLPSNAEVTGSIIFEGQEIIGLSNSALRKIRGKKIGMIFQESSRAFDPLQNMKSVFLETFRNLDPDISEEDALKKAADLLEEVGIGDARNRLKNFPHQFSGGQLQRIGIALSLAQGCQLLIADEPTTALDVTIQAQIIDLLSALRKSRNLSIIFISHNIELVGRFSDKMIVMYGGKIMESGTSDQIMNHPSHPYTQALLSASPKFGTHYSKERLFSIPGRVTDPAHPEPGCPFAPRCSFKIDECSKSDYDCHKCGGKK